MRSCKEVTRLVSEGMDRRLYPWQRLAVAFHLFLCRSCTRFKKQLLFVRRAVREHRSALEEGSAVGLVLPPAARERMKQMLRQGSA